MSQWIYGDSLPRGYGDSLPIPGDKAALLL